jgi:hypothetical protein
MRRKIRECWVNSARKQGSDESFVVRFDRSGHGEVGIGNINEGKWGQNDDDGKDVVCDELKPERDVGDSELMSVRKKGMCPRDSDAKRDTSSHPSSYVADGTRGP